MRAVFPIIVLFLAMGNLSAQEPIRLAGKSLPELRRLSHPTVALSPVPGISPPTFFWRKPPALTNTPTLQQAMLTPSTTPHWYRYDDLAFFCRLEVQLTRSVGVPVKFRLGDVQVVEQMEQQRATSAPESKAPIPPNFRKW